MVSEYISYNLTSLFNLSTGYNYLTKLAQPSINVKVLKFLAIRTIISKIRIRDKYITSEIQEDVK